MSKIGLEIAKSLEFEDGDCAVIIKDDGSIGRVIMPKMNAEVLKTEGYKKLLDVIEVLQPGSREEFIKYSEKDKGRLH